MPVFYQEMMDYSRIVAASDGRVIEKTIAQGQGVVSEKMAILDAGPARRFSMTCTPVNETGRLGMVKTLILRVVLHPWL